MPLTKLSTIALAIASSIAAAACGSEASLSPTGPSGVRAAGGAVIIGRVTGVPTTATTATTRDVQFGTMASTTLTVTIVGTNISTAVDGNGQFALTGVPPGDVQLKFSGSGTDATITLTGVSANDRITITVSLNGRGAQVESEERDHDDDNDEDENEVEGIVSNLGGSCPTLTFTVQRSTVKTNSATRFEHGPCTGIADGVRVDVEGTRQIDGTILATEVEFED